MAKIVIFLVLCSVMAIVMAQNEQPSSVDDDILRWYGISIYSESNVATQFREKVLRIITQRLAVANLPPELQSAGQQILSDATDGLTQCEENLNQNHIIWQYKVCASAQLRNALNAIRLLEISAQQPVTSSA